MKTERQIQYLTRLYQWQHDNAKCGTVASYYSDLIDLLDWILDNGGYRPGIDESNPIAKEARTEDSPKKRLAGVPF